jgi:hypothetical protein
MIFPLSCATTVLALALATRVVSGSLVFSAGFSDDAVFQRSSTDGAMVYGFVDGEFTVMTSPRPNRFFRQMMRADVLLVP